MKLLVSACLLGVACRYDGRSKLHPLAQELCRRHEVIPVCGEIFGGLPTPRLPSERREGSVFASDGSDVTDAFRRGAEEVVRLARLTGAQAAILKERSPSCGCGEIYDGTFTGTVVEGWGVTAELLRREGIPESYARQRVEAQKGDAFFRDNCGYILDNGRDGDPEPVTRRALELFRSIIQDQND